MKITIAALCMLGLQVFIIALTESSQSVCVLLWIFQKYVSALFPLATADDYHSVQVLSFICLWLNQLMHRCHWGIWDIAGTKPARGLPARPQRPFCCSVLKVIWKRQTFYGIILSWKGISCHSQAGRACTQGFVHFSYRWQSLPLGI